MRAALYARYSTEKQSDISIESQIELMKEYCQRKGYEIAAQYVDRARSGYHDSRESFQRMIEDAKKKKFDVIVVYNYSRFSRKAADALLYATLLEEKIGVRIESATEPFENNAAGNFARTVLFAASQLQRDIAAEDTLAKLRSLAKKGFWTGGSPPYGYKIVKVKDDTGRERSRLEINEKEARIVEQIFSLFLEGKSMKEIAKILNERGIRTRSGKNWQVSYISHILKNEKYTGKLIYAKGTKKNHRLNKEDAIVVPGAVPKIIPESVFEEVQERLKIMPKFRTKNTYPYILTGITYCRNGHRMIGCKKSVPFYLCRECGIKISAKKLENFVMGYLKHVLLTDVDFEKLALEINEKLKEKLDTKNEEIEKLKKKKKALQEKLERIVEAIKEGGLVRALAKEASKLESEIEETNYMIRSLHSAEIPQVSPEKLKEKWSELKEMILGSAQMKRKAVFALLQAVIVYEDGFIKVVPKDAEI